MRSHVVVALAAMIAAPALAQDTGLTYSQQLSPNAITAVQQALGRSNAYNGRADGIWGQDSAAALERYQQSHQLQVTGSMNPATAQSLGIDPGVLLGNAPTQAAAPGPRGAMLTPGSVRHLQDRLRRLGYYRGPSDGVWGQGTQDALRAYQQAQGLPPNGDLTENTVRNLGLGPDSLRYR